MIESIAHDIPYQTLLNNTAIRLDIKRLDLVHPHISGNKFYKLQLNLRYAKQAGLNRILTFGGAFSNHIAATAYAAHDAGLTSIGIIRGDELASRPLNPTLQQAQQLGMQFQFVTRAEYRQRHDTDYLRQLQRQFLDSYMIPEGGTNALAVQGCQDILSDDDLEYYDVICCAVGTGGTMSGLVERSAIHQHVLGFSALKGNFLQQAVQHWTQKTNWLITDAYCCGGYAKTCGKLLDFIENFQQAYDIPLEPIYTGKMMMGVLDLIHQGYFDPGTRILAIHSGGLQGNGLLPIQTNADQHSKVKQNLL